MGNLYNVFYSNCNRKQGRGEDCKRLSKLEGQCLTTVEKQSQCFEERICNAARCIKQ